MAEYISNVAATSNGSANTFDEFIEIKAASSTSVQIKRVRVSFITTTPGDNECSIKLMRNSGGGTFTSGTVFTPLKIRQLAPAATATCTIKNGSNGATLGTNVDLPIYAGINTRSVFEWIAADQEEWIESTSGGYVALAISCSGSSLLVNVECVWEE
jgi:hypothetical protein